MAQDITATPQVISAHGSLMSSPCGEPFASAYEATHRSRSQHTPPRAAVTAGNRLDEPNPFDTPPGPAHAHQQHQHISTAMHLDPSTSLSSFLPSSRPILGSTEAVPIANPAQANGASDSIGPQQPHLDLSVSSGAYSSSAPRTTPLRHLDSVVDSGLETHTVPPQPSPSPYAPTPSLASFPRPSGTPYAHAPLISGAVPVPLPVVDPSTLLQQLQHLQPLPLPQPSMSLLQPLPGQPHLQSQSMLGNTFTIPSHHTQSEQVMIMSHTEQSMPVSFSHLHATNQTMSEPHTVACNDMSSSHPKPLNPNVRPEADSFAQANSDSTSVSSSGSNGEHDSARTSVGKTVARANPKPSSAPKQKAIEDIQAKQQRDAARQREYRARLRNDPNPELWLKYKQRQKQYKINARNAHHLRATTSTPPHSEPTTPLETVSLTPTGERTNGRPCRTLSQNVDSSQATAPHSVSSVLSAVTALLTYDGHHMTTRSEGSGSIAACAHPTVKTSLDPSYSADMLTPGSPDCLPNCLQSQLSRAPQHLPMPASSTQVPPSTNPPRIDPLHGALLVPIQGSDPLHTANPQPPLGPYSDEISSAVVVEFPTATSSDKVRHFQMLKVGAPDDTIMLGMKRKQPEAVRTETSAVRIAIQRVMHREDDFNTRPCSLLAEEA